MSDERDTTSKAGPARAVIPLVYKGTTIHERHEMVSLTDMWKAAGSDEQKAPAKWRALPAARAFVEHVALTVGKSDSDLFDTKIGGRVKGTWAHWHVAMAYAKYLDHDFHMWCNEVVRAHMERAPAQPPMAPERPRKSAIDQAAREARLFHQHMLKVGKMAGLVGNQLLIAANRASKAEKGFDALGMLGITHLVAPTNDILVIPTKLGQDLGNYSARRVNELLQEAGYQTMERDHDGDARWRLTEAGKAAGGVVVDVERKNGTGASQQIKWPLSMVDTLRVYINRSAA